ncbi:MAG TPA: DUF4845 domain-containing protein [Lamprocystis sp. (in: g-proteobacteria)]|nr:DUF4845 domain-containing protein [Lamprocystis sp. (in: g-proteobacteria)]
MRTIGIAQRGMGLNSAMVIIALIIFFLTLLFKLGPSYMTYMTMKSIMESVAKSPEPIQGGRATLIADLNTRMMINEVRSIDTKSFSVKKSGEETLDLRLAYEERIHLFANVDAVLTFDHQVVVKGR